MEPHGSGCDCFFRGVGERKEEIIDQHYLIEAGCAKEVNYYLMQPSSDFLRVRLNTNLSQNLPGEYENAMESCNLSRWDEGCFDCDTSLFCPSEMKSSWMMRTKDSRL